MSQFTVKKFPSGAMLQSTMHISSDYTDLVAVRAETGTAQTTPSIGWLAMYCGGEFTACGVNRNVEKVDPVIVTEFGSESQS